MTIRGARLSFHRLCLNCHFLVVNCLQINRVRISSKVGQTSDTKGFPFGKFIKVRKLKSLVHRDGIFSAFFNNPLRLYHPAHSCKSFFIFFL